MSQLAIALDIVDHFLKHPEQIAFLLAVVGFFAIAKGLPVFLARLKLSFYTLAAIVILYYVGNLLYLMYQYA